MAAPTRATAPAPALSAAYARCARLARSHYENFTIGTWLLPRRLRPHLFALYAFCRHTDDLGDEAAGRSQGDTVALLDAWEEDLHRCYAGAPEHPILLALQNTIQRFAIPPEPFHRLIQANRMDQGRVRFPAYADLLRYCDHSANPVGRMVLYVLGDRTTESQTLADATCTALQLANFWQDVRRDYAMGRIYLPREDMDRFGYTEHDLARGTVNARFRALMRFEVDRAQALFAEGMPLIQRVRGRARLDIALFSRGGMRVLDAIRRQDYDTLSRRPVVTGPRKAWLLGTTALRLAAPWDRLRLP